MDTEELDKQFGPNEEFKVSEKIMQLRTEGMGKDRYLGKGLNKDLELEKTVWSVEDEKEKITERNFCIRPALSSSPSCSILLQTRRGSSIKLNHCLKKGNIAMK